MDPAVVVTGLGAISSLGTGVGAIVSAMREGRDGLSTMERVDVRALRPIHLAGWLRERWERGEPAELEAWTAAAAREAWEDARGADGRVRPDRVAVVAGTTLGEEGRITRIAQAAAEAIGARGPRWTVSTACASSANAIGLARDLLLAGDADVVMAGGAEKLIAEIVAGFASLGVLGAGPCAPFGEAVGTTLGEGAGFVVMEREGERDVRARGWVLGYGLSSDAWHETTPDPRGEGIARATLACLRDAAIEPDDVDYVNAHGTGTAANDDSEWRGIQKALGARAAAIPVSSSKGFFGHAQGAAGVLEAIATLACMNEGLIPPSLRIGRGRPRGPRDVVGETGRARAASFSIALSNSAAFGGANAVVALSRRSVATRPRTVRVVSILGAGAIATAAGAARDEDALARACGDIDLRSTDPSSRMAIAAASRALVEAGVRLRGAERDRSGIVGGGEGPPHASVEELRVSLERGLDRASAPAFARTVGHAPIAATARVFGLRGPLSMVGGDGVAGLLAIAYAARWLSHRDDADRIIAGGLVERSVTGLDEEGAALLVLAAGGGAGPRVTGVATAGTRAEALERALAEAGIGEAAIELDVRAEGASAYRSALACIEAMRAIRGGARSALVSAEGTQGAVAIVLAQGES